MSKPQQKSVTLGKRPHEHDLDYNPSNKKKTKIEQDICTIVTQLTKLEYEVSKKNQVLDSKILKLEKAQEIFGDELKRFEQQQHKKAQKIVPNRMPKLQMAPTFVGESDVTQVLEEIPWKPPVNIMDLINQTLKKKNAKVIEPNKIEEKLKEEIIKSNDKIPKSTFAKKSKKKEVEVDAVIDAIISKQSEKADQKTNMKVAKKSGKGSSPCVKRLDSKQTREYNECTDRIQILGFLRKNTNQYTKLSDKQLLYITDPDVLAKLEKTTQSQKRSEFLKSSIFKGYQGKLPTSILGYIYKSFKIPQPRLSKNKQKYNKLQATDNSVKQDVKITCLEAENLYNQKMTSRREMILSTLIQPPSVDSQQNEIHKNLEQKHQNLDKKISNQF